MWTGTDDKIEILWIRHGMTAANKEHRYLGTTDEPLSTEGAHRLISQWKTKEELLCRVDKVYSSPMKRCLETAQLLFEQGKKKQVRVIPQWCEMDFGQFEYKNYRELNGNPDYQAWIDSGGTIAFPGGESRSGFIKRSMEGFARLQEQLKKEVEPVHRICCIVHGGTIMAVLSQLLGGGYYDYQLPNGGSYLVQWTKEAGWTIIE